VDTRSTTRTGGPAIGAAPAAPAAPIAAAGPVARTDVPAAPAPVHLPQPQPISQTLREDDTIADLPGLVSLLAPPAPPPLAPPRRAAAHAATPTTGGSPASAAPAAPVLPARMADSVAQAPAQAQGQPLHPPLPLHEAPPHAQAARGPADDFADTVGQLPVAGAAAAAAAAKPAPAATPAGTSAARTATTPAAAPTAAPESTPAAMPATPSADRTGAAAVHETAPRLPAAPRALPAPVPTPVSRAVLVDRATQGKMLQTLAERAGAAIGALRPVPDRPADTARPEAPSPAATPTGPVIVPAAVTALHETANTPASAPAPAPAPAPAIMPAIATATSSPPSLWSGAARLHLPSVSLSWGGPVALGAGAAAIPPPKAHATSHATPPAVALTAPALSAEPSGPADPEAGMRPPLASDTVLYIEDHAVNLMIVRQMVSRRPHLKLLTAATGLDGLAQARARLPALILLDMQLPDIDGFEVLRRLRADPLTAHIPCMAVSANALQTDIQRALAAGCVEYWTKPLNLQAFLGALDKRCSPAPDTAGTPRPPVA
jgi:CheY-like chemotaxis protein